MSSVTTHKTIASVALQGGIFKYIALDKILEAEAGFTKNEPDQLAVQQAIEKAVYAIVIEGSESNVWSFADKTAQRRLLDNYQEWEAASAEGGNKTKLAGATAPAAPRANNVKTAAVQGNTVTPRAPSQINRKLKQNATNGGSGKALRLITKASAIQPGPPQ